MRPSKLPSVCVIVLAAGAANGQRTPESTSAMVRSARARAKFYLFYSQPERK
jgi:hypothetical protein